MATAIGTRRLKTGAGLYQGPVEPGKGLEARVGVERGASSDVASAFGLSQGHALFLDDWLTG